MGNLWEKMSQCCSCLCGCKAQEKLDRVRRKKWAPKLATSLKLTGEAVSSVGSWIPGVGMIGGALKLASGVLDPKPLLSDIRKELEYQLQSMSNDLRALDDELKATKGLVLETFLLALDSRYKRGIERVEAAYKAFLNGANNLEVTLENISYFIFELETEASQCFNLEHIESYLSMSSEFCSLDESKDIFRYIVFVRAKYLQMVVAFYLYKNDIARVEAEFHAFNDFFEEIVAMYLQNLGKSLLFEEKSADTEQKKERYRHKETQTEQKKMLSLQLEGKGIFNQSYHNLNYHIS